MNATTPGLGDATTDAAYAVGVLFAVAAGFFTVAIHYYFQGSRAAERLFVSRTRKRLRRSARFLQVSRAGRILWLIDVSGVIGLRVIVAVYLGVVWYLLVPLLLTVGSITLAASLVRI